VRAKRADFHEIIDRAVSSHEHRADHLARGNGNNRSLLGEGEKPSMSLEEGTKEIDRDGGASLTVQVCEAIEESATGQLVYCVLP
jgi:hypothetical protein